MPNCFICEKQLSAGLVIDKACKERIIKMLELEQKGLLIALPCKVGAVVWYFDTEYENEGDVKVPRTYITTGTVVKISLGATESVLVSVYNSKTGVETDFGPEHINTIMFFTKEEAEKALARVCRVCGCTWDNACPGGCYWVEDDLCSACIGRAKNETIDEQ